MCASSTSRLAGVETLAKHPSHDPSHISLEGIKNNSYKVEPRNLAIPAHLDLASGGQMTGAAAGSASVAVSGNVVRSLLKCVHLSKQSESSS